MEQHTTTTQAPISGDPSVRRQIAGTAFGVFRGWGYQEIEVPLLDHFDSLRAALDPAQIQRMFRFVDRQGHLLVLRADVTPAIARIFANQLSERPLPLRLCYAHKVVRIERSFTQEKLERYQLGVELIGCAGIAPEVETLLIALETLTAIDVGEFEVHLGSVAVVEHLLAKLGAAERVYSDIIQAIGERDPVEVGNLVADSECPEPVAQALRLLARMGPNPDAPTELRNLFPADGELHAILAGVDELAEALNALGFGGRLFVDLGQVNQQGYYTGTTFKIVSRRIGTEVGSGGRYDNLIGRFGKPCPAVGFCLHLESLMELTGHAASSSDSEENRPTRVTVGRDLVANFSDMVKCRQDGSSAVVDYE
ncbi:MAG: ATP phosphoribosyltransferase regulatory subunit [Myxococcales bacterium]|nr:ATP phosphoribosyltransferase regulatory subunit [Myxococcales bacterium]